MTTYTNIKLTKKHKQTLRNSHIKTSKNKTKESRIVSKKRPQHNVGRFI